MKTISLVCPGCNAQMEVDEDKLLAYCPYCGKKLQMDFPHADRVFVEKEKTKRAKERTERMKIEREYEERARQQEYERNVRQTRENNREGWKALLILVLFWVIVLVGYEIRNSVHYAKGDVKAPISGTSESLKDLNYKDARDMFESAGFQYIVLESKEDLIIGFLKKEGTVDSISINGDSNFSKGSWFSADAKVRIIYHGF